MTLIESKMELHPNVLYMVMTIEDKIGEFNGKLNELSRQLQAVDQERQVLIANINQVQGAITGARIMIDDELKAAGATLEFYQMCKEDFLRSTAEKQPEKGQDNEIAETTNNDAAGCDAG